MGNETAEKETVCAKWTDDCQGKKDYDGRIISLSTRYWPAGGGFHILDAGSSELRLSEDGSIKPSAHASIHLNFGEPDQYGYGDYRELADKEFKGETEAEVKAQVESWAAEKFSRIVALLDGKL